MTNRCLQEMMNFLEHTVEIHWELFMNYLKLYSYFYSYYHLLSSGIEILIDILYGLSATVNAVTLKLYRNEGVRDPIIPVVEEKTLVSFTPVSRLVIRTLYSLIMPL